MKNNRLLHRSQDLFFQKDRYSESRELENMKRYIEQNMKDAEPVFNEAPSVQDKPEESVEKPSPVGNHF